MVNWRQPEPWTIAFVLLTGIVVVGRHPLAKMIGTEVDLDTATPSVVASAAPNPVTSPSHAAVAAAIAAAPTHAPRDPFRSLVKAGDAALAPEAVAGAGAATAAPEAPAVSQPKHHAKPAAPANASCTGTMHTVVTGDTLWSLAATSVKSADTGRVTVAWHKIYRANRPPLSDPSMLPVGAKICLPSSL